ncbi:hypothetical protein M0804_010365 [Polistes exclamans]|nr:hypothetical protein M0804_010365 [Polistes exclamans]
MVVKTLVKIGIRVKSACEDEEHIARGGRTPGENEFDEEVTDGNPNTCTIFPLRMATNTSRTQLSATGVGFLRSAGQQHVNFDPEAPPLSPLEQTTSLLERPDADKKVKIDTYQERLNEMIL